MCHDLGRRFWHFQLESEFGTSAGDGFRIFIPGRRYFVLDFGVSIRIIIADLTDSLLMLLYSVGYLTFDVVHSVGGIVVPLRNRVDLITHNLHLVEPSL